MRAALLTAAALLALMSSAVAQFVAATGSSDWSPARGVRDSTSQYGYSDCTTENALGLTNGGEIVWFQGFDTNAQIGGFDTIVRVASANGWSGSTNGSPPGSVGGVYVYDDPGGDHTNPTDLTAPDLVSQEPWTTCCENMDIKEPVDLGAPAVVSDGFWIAAMLPQAPGEFPAPMDTDTAPSMSRSWITGSNTVFDPLDPGGGIGFFEMATLGFDSHWAMGADGSGDAVVGYCTPKTGLVCGLPVLSWSGIPQAGASNGFILDAKPVRGQRGGLVLYSCTGRAAIPFDGGLICVSPPLRRSSAFDSGGTNGMCDGVFQLDWNAFASGNAGGSPDPCVMTSGQQVNVQFWGRDSVATGSVLSAGLEFSMM